VTGRPVVTAGALLLLCLALWSLAAPWLAADPLEIDLERRLLAPGAGRWLGTDDLGRDVLARLAHGARPSLLVAVLATAISVLVGIPLGALAGYATGAPHVLLARVIDASLAVPALILLLLLAAVFLPGSGGQALPSWVFVGMAIGIVRWGVIARYMRAEVQRLARTPLRDAARAAGAGHARVLARHLVPAGLAPVAVAAAFGAGSAVMAEASLSFLGLGVQPPTPTWGQMIATALGRPAAWWLLLFPGVMVALTVAGFHLVGRGLSHRG
jgi:ABC-type dipeptide/oligopeptide/nickel transport system permease subunit